MLLILHSDCHSGDSHAKRARKGREVGKMPICVREVSSNQEHVGVQGKRESNASCSMWMTYYLM